MAISVHRISRRGMLCRSAQALNDIEFSGWIQIEAAAPHGLVANYTANLKYLKGIFSNRS